MSDGTRRYDVRRQLDEMLARPLDETEAQEYDRGRWGTSDEAVAAAHAKDAMWGENTYGEEPT